MVVFVVAGLVCAYGFWSGARQMSDFAGYYTSSRILMTADSIHQMYNDIWFVNRMHRYGIPDSTLIMYVNPPPVALVMIPLAWMPPVEAKIAWNAIGVVLLIVAFELLRRLLNSPRGALTTTVMGGIFFCTLPFLRNLQRGQIYILMLVILILVIHGYLNARPHLTSVSLAVLLLLKLFGGVFLLLFLFERRWKELAFTVLYVLAGYLLSLAVFGADTYRAHVEVLGAALTRSDFAFTGLPCVPAMFGSLFTFHPLWNTNPVVDLPWFATTLTAVSLATMVFFTFAETTDNQMGRLSAIVIISVIFTPLAADHHYILLLWPASYIVTKLISMGSGRWQLFMVGIVVILVLGWYPLPKMGSLAGLTKLLAFPRLYASVFLWILVLHRDRYLKQVRPL